MIQDIFPQRLDNQYRPKKLSEGGVVFFFRDDQVLCEQSGSEIRFPRYRAGAYPDQDAVYLFEISGVDFFLAGKLADEEPLPAFPGFAFENVGVFRTARPKHLAFAGITAHQIYLWYRDNQFCGRCGRALRHDARERMMRCDGCNNQIYPKIAPAVIVGVTDGNKLLMTRYTGRELKRYSLVAGFIEVGENAEEAVRREVMEEVGVNVKNIVYYKSQPWGFSGSLLFGYYAELDGDAKLSVDETELAEAVWLERDEIQVKPDDLSLTNEMICRFREN